MRISYTLCCIDKDDRDDVVARCAVQYVIATRCLMAAHGGHVTRTSEGRGDVRLKDSFVWCIFV